MNHKVTVIGGSAAPASPAAPADESKAGKEVPKPTVIGGGPAASPFEHLQGDQPPLAPLATTAQGPVKPTVFRPAAGPVQPAGASGVPATEEARLSPSVFAPKAMNPSPPVAPVSPGPERASRSAIVPSAIRPSAAKRTAPQVDGIVSDGQAATFRPVAMPGTQRRPVEVSHAVLEQAFPRYSPEDRDIAQAALAGFSLGSANPTTVLSFGKVPQEDLTTIARERLVFAQRPGVRYVLQHLARLQTLLQDVLESFEGGFLRKSPEKVWRLRVGEIQQLEHLLDAADDKLSAELGELAAMKVRCEACKKVLGGTALAAEYLLGQLQDDLAGLMLSRLGSITASQAMVLDQIHLIDRDAEQLQELTLLVQDGVVLKLPAVYAQLSALGGRMNDTERFHAVERLTDVLNPLKARNPT